MNLIGNIDMHEKLAEDKDVSGGISEAVMINDNEMYSKVGGIENSYLIRHQRWRKTTHGASFNCLNLAAFIVPIKTTLIECMALNIQAR